MKDVILGALTLAAKHNLEIANIANKRIIGEKEDVVTEGDLEIGQIITNSLLNFKKGVVVESEEYGKQANFDDGEPEEFYVAIDDIDGTNNFRVGNGLLPYASMIVAFDGKNKTQDGYKYSDYSHAACIDYTSNQIYYTEKGLGVVEVYDLNFNKIKDSSSNMQDNSNLALTLSTDIVSTQRGGAVGYAKSTSNNDISVLPGILDSVFKNYAIVDSGCSVVEYARVGLGIRNGYVSVGKKQHELPLLYAFANETDLKMVDFKGNSYGDKVYDFNGKDAQVVAASPEVVENVLLLIRKQAVVINKITEILKTYRDKTKQEQTSPWEDGEIPF